MEHREVVRRRRMVRHFRPDPIPEATIEAIVAAIRRGPSAGYAQGVSLVVVTSAERRAAIAALAGEQAWVARGKDPWLSTAPVHLVLCVEPGRYRSRYQEPDKDPAALEVPWWWVDGGAALMLGLLAAVDTGLAAGFLGAHAVPGLDRLLGIPPEVEVVGIITVGLPAPHALSRSLRRGRRSDGVHREAWEGGAG